MVPRAGLEPAHPKAVDFESTASTNFATQAHIDKEHQIRFVLYRFIDRLQVKNDFLDSIVFIFISVAFLTYVIRVLKNNPIKTKVFCLNFL